MFLVDSQRDIFVHLRSQRLFFPRAGLRRCAVSTGHRERATRAAADAAQPTADDRVRWPVSHHAGPPTGTGSAPRPGKEYVIYRRQFRFTMHTNSVPDSDWIRIQLGQWIRIWIRNPNSDPGGQTWRSKIEKLRNFTFWSAGSLLRAEGFFCSLDVLYGGLGIGKFSFFIKTLDPDWIRIGIQPKMLDPDPYAHPGADEAHNGAVKAYKYNGARSGPHLIENSGPDPHQSE